MQADINYEGLSCQHINLHGHHDRCRFGEGFVVLDACLDRRNVETETCSLAGNK